MLGPFDILHNGASQGPSYQLKVFLLVVNSNYVSLFCFRVCVDPIYRRFIFIMFNLAVVVFTSDQVLFCVSTYFFKPEGTGGLKMTLCLF